MTVNKKPIHRSWRDPDDAPDLSSPQWRKRFETADVMDGPNAIRRGRPPAGNTKISTTVRLDADVVKYFKSEGRGWQTRLNAALRKAAGLTTHKP